MPLRDELKHEQLKISGLLYVLEPGMHNQGCLLAHTGCQDFETHVVLIRPAAATAMPVIRLSENTSTQQGRGNRHTRK